MIRVTRLNGHAITLNSDLIKFVEMAPDTVITLTNGEKLIVLETEEEVLRLVKEFRCSMNAANCNREEPHHHANSSQPPVIKVPEDLSRG